MDKHSKAHNDLLETLRDFIEGRDRSIAAAGRLEVALDEMFPDDEGIADVVLALASYRPGGGEYLYDEHQVAKLCEWVLSKLEPPTRASIPKKPTRAT